MFGSGVVSFAVVFSNNSCGFWSVSFSKVNIRFGSEATIAFMACLLAFIRSAASSRRRVSSSGIWP